MFNLTEEDIDFFNFLNNIPYDDKDDLDYVKENLTEYLFKNYKNIKEKHIEKIVEKYIEEYFFIADDIIKSFQKLKNHLKFNFLIIHSEQSSIKYAQDYFNYIIKIKNNKDKENIVRKKEKNNDNNFPQNKNLDLNKTKNINETKTIISIDNNININNCVFSKKLPKSNFNKHCKSSILYNYKFLTNNKKLKNKNKNKKKNNKNNKNKELINQINKNKQTLNYCGLFFSRNI